MKVLLVNGSPHQKGSTYTSLMEVSRTLEEEGIGTDLFWVGIKPLAGCLGCGKCAEKNQCVFKDRVNEFLDIAANYNGFIFGSPVHWGASSGQIKCFMDRAFFADFNGNGGRFALKPAAVVVCARRAGITATIDQLNKYFALCQMPIISARYWNGVHGLNAEDVVHDLEGMQDMRFLARNMAYFLKCREAADKAGIPLPKQEEVTFTNFIR